MAQAGTGCRMIDIRKGDQVLIVEGPHRGVEGTCVEVERKFDRDTQTTGKRIEIQTGLDDNEKPITIETRLAWVRRV